MNMRLIALLLLAALTVQGAVPPPKRTVAKPAQVSADPRSKVEAAARGKLTAYFQDKNRLVGSAGVSVQSVSVKIEETEPVAGWTGRWRSSGTAVLTLFGGQTTSSDRKQTRHFDVYATVTDKGAVEIVDISSN